MPLAAVAALLRRFLCMRNLRPRRLTGKGLPGGSGISSRAAEASVVWPLSGSQAPGAQDQGPGGWLAGASAVACAVADGQRPDGRRAGRAVTSGRGGGGGTASIGSQGSLVSIRPRRTRTVPTRPNVQSQGLPDCRPPPNPAQRARAGDPAVPVYTGGLHRAGPLPSPPLTPRFSAAPGQGDTAQQHNRCFNIHLWFRAFMRPQFRVAHAPHALSGYSGVTQRLLSGYSAVTQGLLRGCAGVTQGLRRGYAGVNLIIRPRLTEEVVGRLLLWEGGLAHLRAPPVVEAVRGTTGGGGGWGDVPRCHAPTRSCHGNDADPKPHKGGLGGSPDAERSPTARDSPKAHRTKPNALDPPEWQQEDDAPGGATARDKKLGLKRNGPRPDSPSRAKGNAPSPTSGGRSPNAPQSPTLVQKRLKLEAVSKGEGAAGRPKSALARSSPTHRQRYLSLPLRVCRLLGTDRAHRGTQDIGHGGSGKQRSTWRPLGTRTGAQRRTQGPAGHTQGAHRCNNRICCSAGPIVSISSCILATGCSIAV